MILHEAKNEHWYHVEMLALTPCHFNGTDSGESLSDDMAVGVFAMPWSSMEPYAFSDSDDEDDDMEEDDFDDMEEEDFDDDFDDEEENEDDDFDDEEDDYDEDDDFDDEE